MEKMSGDKSAETFAKLAERFLFYLLKLGCKPLFSRASLASRSGEVKTGKIRVCFHPLIFS